MVMAGTGEALPGPAASAEIEAAGAARPITGVSREVAGCREGVGGGRITA